MTQDEAILLFGNLSDVPVHTQENYLDTSALEALRHAVMSADKYELPQTVFHKAGWGGWNHAHPYAKVLDTATSWVSILPATYYRK